MSSIEKRTLTGYLCKDSVDDTYHMELQEDDDILIPVAFTDDHFYLNVMPPLNRLISLGVVRSGPKQPWVASASDKNFVLVDDVQGMAVLYKHFAIFKCVKLDATPENIAHNKAIVEDAAKQVQAYWRTYFRGKVEIECRGYVMPAEDTINTRPPGYGRVEIKAFQIANPDIMDGYEPNYWHCWGGYYDAYCGQGSLGRNNSTTYYNRGNCGVRTIIHELGHNLNLWHAGVRSVDGNETEYGDQSCIMGANQGIRGLHSPYMLQLGFDTDREIHVVGETQQLIIAPIELSAEDLHPNEYQHVLLRSTGQPDITLSRRKIKGFPYAQPKNEEKTLYVHLEESSGRTKRLEPDLQPGDSRELPNGMIVEYLEYANESARVNILVGQTPSKPLDISMPIGLPIPPSMGNVTDEHTGSWFDPFMSGQGLNLVIHDNTLGGILYTYNDDESSRRYYLFNAPINEAGQATQFEILTTFKGTFEDPGRHEEYSVGNGTLTFVDGVGYFTYNINGRGRGTLKVQPAALTNDPDSGIYWDSDKIGSGLSINLFDTPDGKRCTAAWYNYGPKKPIPPIGGRVSGTTDQRWYSCEGAAVGPYEYHLDIYECYGGSWMSVDTPTFEVIGKAVLWKTIDGVWMFTYDFAGDGVEEVGALTLTRGW